MTLADEVLEAAGARDDDVGAGPQAVDLRALPDTAEDGLGAQPGRSCQRLESDVDLADEAARRGQDQGARRARTGTPLATLLTSLEPGHQRQQEGVGLAGAGAAAAEHVAPGE